MISKSEVHNKIFESELVQLENEYEKLEEQYNSERSKIKKVALKEQCDELKRKHDNLNKDSRLKEYKRKSESLARRLSAGVFFMQEGKNAKTTLFTIEQAYIYFVLIRLASMHNSWVSVWCNEGIDGFNSQMIVELYEYIKENIYRAAGIDGWGKSPYIDQWLQLLDVELDYTMSKRVCTITALLEKIRKEGLAINHQINYGSIVCKDEQSMYYARGNLGAVDSALPKQVDPFAYDDFHNEEQYFAGLEKLATDYLDSVKQKSARLLEWGIGYGKCVMEFNQDEDELPEENNEDIQLKNAQENLYNDFPEYEQRNKNLIKFVKSDADTAADVLEKIGMGVEEAVICLEHM